MKKHTSLLAAFAMCAVSAMAPTEAAPQSQATRQQPVDAMAVYKARSQMRQVWGEHLVYARNHIISTVAGLNDAEVVSNRLLENATDIGNTLRPYYGDVAAQKLTTLMREHVMLLAEVARVASGNSPGSQSRTSQDVDKDQLSEVQRRLETNGKNIASFLASSNPNWKASDVEGMMQDHVQEMIDQITARANADWQGDVEAYDEALDHVFQFADMLSQGIERQFPDRFAQAAN